MKKVLTSILLVALISSCKEDHSNDEINAQQKQAIDSISKATQRKITDSLKKSNPLLILPPDSQYTGDYVDKYPTGIIKFKGFYRQGERHGQWMSFYPNGVIWSEMTYDKGLREGTNISYYNTGKKRYEGNFKQDMQDSIWFYYNEEEGLTEKVIYKENQIVKKLPIETKDKQK